MTRVQKFYNKDNTVAILICDDFFNVPFSEIKEHSIDACITDFPYGILNCRNKWDHTWDYTLFWKRFNQIKKNKSTPLISTSAQPFTTLLISSNYQDFKYTLVWEKSKATGYLNARKQPMRAHEDIVVFYEKQCVYNPQMNQGKPYNKGLAIRDTLSYSVQTKPIHVKNESGLRYPRSVQYFVTAENEGKFHPTQKPVALYEWLVKTYTNPKNLVLDPCFGSGTTAIACLNTNRNFIGCEKNEHFFQLACQRLVKYQY